MINKADLDYNQIVMEFKDLVESMAFVALQKMRKPSPYSFEDLCQEGYIVCVEWVKRWWNPERGASLKTFITGGLRLYFTDFVKLSYKSNVNPCPVSALQFEDEDGTLVDSEVLDYEKTSTEPDPVELASFNETMGRFTPEELQYVLQTLSRNEKGRSPSRANIRKTLGLSDEKEEEIRASIMEKLSNGVEKPETTETKKV